MAAAGCGLLQETASKAAMTYKAFGQVYAYWRLIGRIRRLFRKELFDLVVVCDSPSFNFHVARLAKRAGFPTLFYVAPQLWAWAGWRIGKLRRTCDKLACILPFEEHWFAARGLDAVYVGHPLLDEMPGDLSVYAKKYDDFRPSEASFALMPGSRPAELRTLWPAMQELAVLLRGRYPACSFCAVASDERQAEILRDLQKPGLDCSYTVDSVINAAAQADFSIVASGSATLQVAAAGCPMIVLYQSSKILWHLAGRWLVKTPYLCLVNILAREELVPEFMPYFGSIDSLAAGVIALVEDKNRLAVLSRRLVDLAGPLHRNKAARRAAAAVLEMLGKTDIGGQ